MFEQITINLRPSKDAVRNETLEGIEYLVVPAVMIVEGVLEGSNGKLYYPGDELSKTPQVWNHKPLVINHPAKGGKPRSACDPQMVEEYKVGLLMNTRFSTGPNRLKTECWFNLNSLHEKSPETYYKVQNGEKVEVSTGLFTDNEAAEGTYNGREYDAIARNYRPDHLAVLPDSTGACSIADGAGLMQNSQFSTNELSHDEIRELLSKATRDAEVSGMAEDMNTWVLEVYEGRYIYNHEDQLFVRGYTINADDTVTIDSERSQVRRVTEYRTVEGNRLVGNFQYQPPKESDMDKDKIISDLISNDATPFTDSDKEGLAKMDDKTIAELGELAGKATPPETDPPKKDPTETATKEELADAAAKGAEGIEGKPKKEEQELAEVNQASTFNEWLDTAPPEYREMLQSGMHAHDQQKTDLIEQIVGNEQNTFTKEELAGQPIETLQKMAKLATNQESQEPVQPQRGFFSYAGAAGAPPTANQQKERTPLGLPTMDFSQQAS